MHSRILFSIFIAVFITNTTFAQSDKSYEEKYEVNNPDLPEWVKMMYAEGPNLNEVQQAYENYYQENTFEKNKYTQYYKRWIRDKWQYADAEGFVNMPDVEDERRQQKEYIEKVNDLRSRNTNSTANWEELGPWEYDHYATMDLSVQSPGAAHVYTVEQSRSNPNTVYAGTANAGVWKSTDKGMSWSLMTADYLIREVYSIEIDHTNADHVYCHSNGNIWKTIDGGATWTQTGGGQYFSWTRDIKMHPTNNQILLAATTSGLYRTLDAGNTWTQILGGHFQEIEFHPTSVSTVYVIKQTGNRTEFYKSTDAGLSFTIKTNGWPGLSSSTSSGNFTSCDFDSPTYASFSNLDLGSATYPDFTIEMRVKSSGWSGDPALISNKNWNSGLNKGFILAANGSGWKFNLGDGTNRIDLDGSTINDNLWHHIAVTYSATGEAKVYQDGQLISSIATNVSTDVLSGLNLGIAQDGTLNYGSNFPGNIADVRIWNAELSESNLSDWQCQTVDNTHPAYANLLHYWKMDEGTGTSITDYQGTNNGTIIGTAGWQTTNEMLCLESSYTGLDEQKRTEISVSAAAPDNIYILSTGDVDGGSGLVGFYKSTDAGESFSFTCCGTGPGGLASSTNKNIVGYSYDLDAGGGQYYYDLSMGVSPTDPDRIMAAGISVVRSENGGVDWETNAHWVTWVGPNTKQRYTHADVHEVKFFQDGGNVDMWVASDGGLYYSSDQGDNVEPRMHGIHGTEFWGFGGSYKEDAMVGGTYHNGTLAHYKDTYLQGKNGKGGWFAGGAGDATRGYIHEANGKLMFEEGGLFEITNRDTYWKFLNFDNSKRVNQVSPGTYGNYAWHPNLYEVYYVPNESILYKTEDNGASWDLIHDFGTGPIYEIKIPVTDPDIIYVVQNDNSGIVKLWKTTDGGANWLEITPSNGDVDNNNWRDKLFDIDLDNPDNIWLLLAGDAGGYKVFKSTNGGGSWTNITDSNLSGETMLDLVHHQGTDGGIYVGSTNAIYYRNNSHSDWEIFNQGLPLTTRSNYLYPYYTEGKIRMGTYRGAFQSDFYEEAAPTARISVDKNTANCNRDTFSFKDLSYVDHTNVSWSWTFENGIPATSTEENPLVVFAEGTHDVSLTVTNDFGSSSMVLSDFITVAHECTPDTIPGNGLAVIGTNSSYAKATHADNLNFGTTTNFTITAWIKTTSTASDAVIIAKKDWDTGLNSGWVISTQNGKLWVNIGDGSNRADLVPTPLINDGGWHHIAISFNRSSDVIIYLDGVNVGAQSITSVGNIDNTLDMVIGADSEFDYPINAFIDEVCIYNEALSQNEIRERRHLTQKEITANLVSYYQFNEVDGEILDRLNTNHLSMGSSASRSTSSVPAGGGTSWRMDVASGGFKNFTGTGVTMEFPNAGTYPDGELVVTRINLAPDYEPGTLNEAVYFLVNNYGANASFSTLESIQFDELGNITNAAAANPSVFKLFKRTSNNDGNTWGTEIDEGDSAISGVDGSVTFSTGNSITGFSQFVVVNNSVLPVEWLSFNAILLPSNEVELVWKIGAEIDNEKYIVERSKDGIDYVEIGQIKAEAKPEYKTIDSTPLSGNNYYRIKQVDWDGKYSYSVVRHILFNASADDFAIYPNPGPVASNVIFKSTLDDIFNIEIFDAKGSLVQNTIIQKEGNISTKNLSAGVYFYRVKNGAKVSYGRLVLD